MKPTNPTVQNYLENLTEQPSLVSHCLRTLFLRRQCVALERHLAEMRRLFKLWSNGYPINYIVESVALINGSLSVKLKREDGSPQPGVGISFHPFLWDKLNQTGNGVIVCGFPDGPSPNDNVYIFGVVE